MEHVDLMWALILIGLVFSIVAVVISKTSASAESLEELEKEFDDLKGEFHQFTVRAGRLEELENQRAEEGKAEKNMKNFEKDLAGLINSYSLENKSNTPDFILAKYLVSCLKAYNSTVNARDKWHDGKTIA